jgi:microsomal dipeptidase-like Zn-dependent dipeptidase
MAESVESALTIERVPLGGDYWKADPGVPVWGMADIHAHMMAHLAFGGRAFWGQPYDPEHTGDEALANAMASCEPIHGGLLDANPEFGHPAGGGWPDFDIWPRFTTLVHQQGYIDWVYRAYQGGLRLITALAVNNELLATRSDPQTSTDDRSAIQIQVSGMRAMVEHIDKQCGGRGKGWMQIVYSPEEAAKVISENRLAVVLGVEVDSLGNWRRSDDLQQLSQGSVDAARHLIAEELDWLYGLGIRQITPIHLTNNAFGGTAIYMRFLEVSNRFVTGQGYEVEDAWETGIRYRLDHDGTDMVDSAERRVVMTSKPIVKPHNMNHGTLVDHVPGVRSAAAAIEGMGSQGAHANQRTLSIYGHILLEEMMNRGMLIDIDHMSQKTLDAALEMAEAASYPVLSSHAWFRDLAFSADVAFEHDNIHPYGTGDVHKVAHELGKRADQIERVAKLGGVVAPILNQGDMAGLCRAAPELADKVPHPCAGSTTAWAQAFLYVAHKMGGRGVAMGSDLNGAAALPGPRFGTLAAFGASDDEYRASQRRAEIDSQTNGVRYDTPIRDYRWFRFLESGAGGYDEDEREIWQAVAQYKAGFNPWVAEHPEDDSPHGSLRKALQADQWPWVRARIDDISRGLWAADDAAHITPEILISWPRETRAGFLARTGGRMPGTGKDEELLELIEKTKDIWGKWDAMQGDNPPLKRCTAGPRRDFDYNLDGFAHFGLLPDFLQDMRNCGLTPEDMAPLFRSAYDYVQMWSTCAQKAANAGDSRASEQAGKLASGML